MLIAENTVLVVIDIQGNLYESMTDKQFIFDNNRKIISGMRVFDIPVVTSEQIPEKLGPTIPGIAELIDGSKIISKECFSCWKNQNFMKEVMALNRRQIVITGIEAHVCVYQTVMDLLKVEYQVYVVADAVSSRTAINREIGIARMRDAGAAIVSTEMVLFELLQTAGSDKFREIFKIVK